MSTGKLYVITGSSGAGKTTLLQAIIQEQKELGVGQNLYDFPLLVVTYTTRAPRAHEKNGVDYYFITEQDFKEKVEQNFFAEWSCAYGAYYGMPASIFIDIVTKDHSYIAILDRTGAKTLKQKYQNLVYIIWLELGLDELSKRLVGRKSNSLDDIAHRLALARVEQEEEKQEKIADLYIDSFLLENSKSALLSLFLRK